LKKKSFYKVCFLHIPKTAGTTLTNIISRNYSEVEMAQIYFRGKHHDAIAAAIANPQVKIIFGHYTFAEVNPFEGLYHFTFLRHPINQIISHYLHLKYSTDPPHKELIAKAGDFLGFLQLIQGNNLQTRRLVSVYAPAFMQMQESEIVSMAKENIQNMGLVGIAERFNESITILAHDLGWKHLAHRKKNTSKKQMEAQELKARYSDEIMAANRIDIELYTFANQLLDERLSQLTTSEKVKLKLNFLR